MYNTHIIDISKKIAKDTAVWPGDTAVNIATQVSINAGDMVNLTTLTLSAHTASHADAPYHVTSQGLKMDQVDLLPYWGLAQVVTAQKKEGSLLPEDFSMYDLSLAPRLLVRTPAGKNPYNRFPNAFPHPDPALSDYLKECGVVLYGTDAPSMDALESTTLPGHQAMVRNKIAILEGLDLGLADDGLYELCALPLKIAGGDGSPVRAALRRVD
ncbi:MAG: cyclase family protein [Candidatus Promineifilaceae bacterium]